MSSHSLGANFNKEELENIQKGLTVYTDNNQYYTNDGTTYYDSSSGIAVNEWGTSLLEIENTSTAEIQAIADDGGYTFEQAQQIVTGESYTEFEGGSGSSNNSSQNTDKTNKKKSTPITYRDPLRKIAGGRVLQYPIDLDTDIQDYFEIQVFKYRPAGSLPRIDSSNQGSNPAGAFQPSGSYSSNSNRRGNRQNFRLQDLQSTIQLPMPPSIKDNNSVDFAGGSMSGFAAQIFGPAVNKFLSGEAVPETEDKNLLQSIRSQATGILLGGVDLAKETLGAGIGALRNKEF